MKNVHSQSSVWREMEQQQKAPCGRLLSQLLESFLRSSQGVNCSAEPVSDQRSAVCLAGLADRGLTEQELWQRPLWWPQVSTVFRIS